MTIPSSGLLGQTGKGEGSVYVVRDGKAHKVDVRVGNDNGVETEILARPVARGPGHHQLQRLARRGHAGQGRGEEGGRRPGH